jgi:hypothetical protein
VAHVEHAPAGLAHHGERLGQQIVQALAVREALAESDRHRRELRVRELAQPRLERPDFSDDRPDLLELALVPRADDTGEQGVQHRSKENTRRDGGWGGE